MTDLLMYSKAYLKTTDDKGSNDNARETTRNLASLGLFFPLLEHSVRSHALNSIGI
jgi:hypothetical protein